MKTRAAGSRPAPLPARPVSSAPFAPFAPPLMGTGNTLFRDR